MKTFIDFVNDAAKNAELGKAAFEMLQGKSHTELAGWFKEQGYDVSPEDCQKLMENKEYFKSSVQIPHLQSTY